MGLLNNEKITQYFIDSTYRCVHLNYVNTIVLLLIIGCISDSDMLELCCVVFFLLKKENY